jgi:phospholipid/cholesterol/gamma-HCH transport system substrate-binding protein
MSGRALAGTALGAVVVAVILAIVLSGGSSHYKLTTVVDDTGGLRDGSPVVIGGVSVGTVSLSEDMPTRKVRVEMDIQPKYAPVDRNATVAVVAQNLLGKKEAELVPGGGHSRPAPSGFEIPSSRVTFQASLDQVLDVLDAPTRARLAVFINEAGAAVTGRRADFNKLLRELAPALGNGTTLLSQLDQDNRVLENLLSTSDRFVAQVTHRRHGLERLVDQLGQTATTVATKQADLRQTLSGAPGALQTLSRFLGELRSATVPLDPAVKKVSAATPPLETVLDRIGPFRKAAMPALHSATRVAPSLTRLADRVTPILHQAVPTLHQVSETATQRLPGVASTLNGSIDNIVSVLENWARAIQFHDGLSHIFRGEASIAPNLLNSAIRRLQHGSTAGQPAKSAPLHPPKASKPRSQPSASAKAKKPAAQTRRDPLHTITRNLGNDVDHTVQHAVGDVGHTVTHATHAVSGIVHRLLHGGQSSRAPQSSSPESKSNPAGGLLHYLLGP